MQSEPATFAHIACVGAAVLSVLLAIALLALALLVARARRRRGAPAALAPLAPRAELGPLVEVLPAAARDAAPAGALPGAAAEPAGVADAVASAALPSPATAAREEHPTTEQPAPPRTERLALPENEGGGAAPEQASAAAPRATEGGDTTGGDGEDPHASALVLAERSVHLGRRSDRRTRYPVVFAHGLFGFDAIEVRGRRHEYFRGISRALQRMDTEVYCLRVPPVAGIAARARKLAEQIRRLPAKRVNIVAHSMGGLDARYAISELGLSEVVASLTTIGTPHRGTPLADLSAPLLGRRNAIEALGDLTTTSMAEFNRRFADVRGVEYRCFVSSVRGGIGNLPPLLVPAYLFLSWQVGDNDGLVPAESQRWGDVMGYIDADHWGQIGWSRGFDASSFYGQLVDQLGEQGL